MGTLQKVQAAISSKVAIKDAIESKGVVVGNIPFNEYAGKIEEIGGEEEYLDDVIFIDYDGTVVYRYTAQAFLELTELPDNPTHEGLTSQGWNWTLAEAKAYVTAYGKLTIGQMYVTTDGKTRIFITLEDSNYLSPTFYFYQSVANGVTIDWGDGSTAETTSGTGNKSLTHTYASIGDYVIEITITSGEFRFGNNTVFTSIFGSSSAYSDALRKIYLGSGTKNIQGYSFLGCQNFSSITMPNVSYYQNNYSFNNCGLKAFIYPRGVTNTGYQQFNTCLNLRVFSFCGNQSGTYYNNLLSACHRLTRIELPIGEYQQVGVISECTYIKSVVFPEGITKIQQNNAHKIEREMRIPNSVTEIANQAFSQSFNLRKLFIGSGITTIGTYNFSGSQLLEEIHIYATTPPTIQTTTFPTSWNPVIYVPQGKLSAYQTATNWSAYASYMQEEPTT